RHGRTTPGAVAGGGAEATAAFRAKLSVGFRTQTVGRARGSGCRNVGGPRDGGRPLGCRGGALTRCGLRAERRQRLRRVLALQSLVVGIRELPGRPIELDLLQRPERDGPRGQVVVRILPF